LGTAEIVVNIGKSKFYLSAPTAVMIILCLFNKRDTYTFEELCFSTSLPKQMLQSLLANLSNKILSGCLGTILLQVPGDNSSFSLNPKFNAKVKAIKFPNRF